MICKIPQMALELDEKVELQKWLREHEKICIDIGITCSYKLTFSAHAIYAVCKECDEKHKLTR